MDKFSVSEIIEQAVQTEKLGYAFYTDMARRFEENNALKKLFGTLALKEQKHEKVFSQLKEKTGVEEPEGWEEASMYLRAIVESELFLGKNKSLHSLKHVKNERDAVNLAIGFEKEALLYFHGLRDIVEDKTALDTIIHEEKSHIRELSELKRMMIDE
jgi:rubrerythrin